MANQENKKIRIAILAFAFVFIAIAVISNVLAIGITPGRVTLDFQPGMHKEIEFKIVNNEFKDMKVIFSAFGELVDYVTLNTKSTDFSSAEREKSFTYTIDLPAQLPPGDHEVKIAAAELPPSGAEEGVYIGATVVVTSQLIVKVPYPYKYAEITLMSSPQDKTTNFFVEVNNLGQHDLVDISANIEILGPTNERIAIIKTNSKTIEAMHKGELKAQWKADVNFGKYKAIATLVYDEGRIATAEHVFSVGTLAIDIIDINVKNFRLGDIAKFDMTLENKWNEEVKNVYANLQINDEKGDLIADTKTASVDMKPMAREVLNAYWDTAGIKEGTYSGKLLLNFANQVLEKQLKTEITLNSIKVEIIGVGITARATAAEGGRQNLMFILIIVLVIINIAWFIYFKRKSGKK